MKLFIILTLIICCNYVKSAKILGIFPTPSTSHYTLGSSLMKGLAEAGHDITIITPIHEKNLPKNGTYREIFLSGLQEQFENLGKEMNLFESQKENPLKMFKQTQEMLFKTNEETLNHPNVKQFISSKEQFDVVILEQFFNDAMKVFSHLFDAPLIMFCTVSSSGLVNDMIGNPEPISYIPTMMTNYPIKMNFIQRVHNTILWFLSKGMNNLLIMPRHAELVKNLFPSAPPLQKMYTNVSLVLTNSHESMNQALPTVPNLVQIGGFHIKSSKKLPDDLQEFLDNAKEGVIYFSLGSYLKSKNLPPERRNIFLNTFRKLKEKVLWKWEDDILPGQPPNVKLSKWFPQQDILAHPNIKLFITHGGLLSTTETIYHGVPILAIPVFADQFMNANFAVRSGFAKSLPYMDESFSEEKLLSLIQELLGNPSYRENVKKKSQLFHDRPMKPMDSAVYWVEHVIRAKGAPHLRVAGVDFPWYKYFLLDVIGFIVVVITLALSLLYIAIRKLFKIIVNKKRKSKVE